MAHALYDRTDAVSNKYNLRTLLLITVIFVFVWILNLLGIFINDTAFFWKIGICIAVILTATFTYFKIAGYDKPEGKYVVLIALILAINVAYVFLTYHITLALLFPLISAALYRSKKVLWITYALNVVALFIATPLSYNLGLCDANAVLTTTSTVEDFISKLPGLEPLVETPILNLELFYAVPRCLIMVGVVPLLAHITVVIDEQTKQLIESQARNLELSKQQQATQQKIIASLSAVIESRDQVTGAHIHNTASYVAFLTTKLQDNGAFADTLTPKYADLSVRAAPLHDVGKIKVMDAILCKPGRLTAEEYEQMKLHTVYGKNIMSDIIGDIEDDDYLETATEMALGHHERYDGTGYPNGIKGEDIPLCARIMAVADVLDALLSKRQYKEPFSLEKAKEIMSVEYGKQFDPVVLSALLDNWDEFVTIYNQPFEDEASTNT